MRAASAWAPGNISCVFEICKAKTQKATGSRGMGFTIDKGATVKVSEAPSTAVFYNKKKVGFPTVGSVIKELTKKKMRVDISSQLPLGAGFGMSGASALGAAYAINRLLKLGKSKKELAMVAHYAEVKQGTGLGDVVNQYHGGFLAKFKPSGEFEVKRLGNQGAKIYCLSFGKISTKKVIADEKMEKQINKAGIAALSSLEKLVKKRGKPSLPELISLSKAFALDCGLLRDERVKQVIADVEKRGGHSSMIMLGNAVFSDIVFEGAMQVRISNKGAS